MATIPTAAETRDQDALAMRRRRLTLALLTLTYFFSYMDRQILAILQELIRKDLHLSDTQLGLLSGLAFAIFYATLGIPVARLADRLNRRNIIVASLTVWSAMTALGGLATNFWQLLAARIGVGIGEAGSSPPSHSIIADLYPPNERAGAMAIYSLGVVLGAAVGTFIGGTVAHYYGWRVAMFTVGLPGIALALLVWWLVVEPRRGLSDSASQTIDPLPAEREIDPRPSLKQGFASIFRNRAAVHLIAAFTLTSTVGYGLTAWGPSYMQRSLGMSMLQVSVWVAPLGAIAGSLSAVLGGKIADWLARRRGLHAQSWLVSVAKAIALPFALAFYIVEDPAVAITFYLIAVLFQNTYLGVTFALIQHEAPVRMRALWAAITLLINNLIGLGLGPTVVGWISDALRPSYGEESLRYSMFFVCALAPWAIFHYWRAGVWLKRGASRPAQQS